MTIREANGDAGSDCRVCLGTGLPARNARPAFRNANLCPHCPGCGRAAHTSGTVLRIRSRPVRPSPSHVSAMTARQALRHPSMAAARPLNAWFQR